MRRSVGALVTLLLVTAGCTSTTSTGTSESKAVATTAPAVSLSSLDVDWPAASGTLDPGKPPATPEGFDDAMLTRMAAILTDWAQVTTTDKDVWHDEEPTDAVTSELPAAVAGALRDQVTASVSPRLAVANVFGDEVTVVGSPLVTTAWKVSTEADEDGKQFVSLELQTRAAYEVRLGDDAPTRVIGMLRVHGLTAYADTTDDFGVTYGWQEFGAGDCALALDDELVPDPDLDQTVRDLKTFVEVGDGTKLTMPTLDDDEQVDEAYLQRCRDGAT